MKNSREYAQKVQKLYRSWKREYPKVQNVTHDEPTDAIVYATLSENMSEAATKAAIKKFTDYFVDLNDLRISRAEEIIELLEQDTSVTRQIAYTLTKTLMAIFDEYHTISLKALRKVGKRPAKQVIQRLDGISHFVVNYCMLTAMQGHAIPLTKQMLEYLKSSESVDPEADEQQIEGFLTRQISAKNAYEFYALLRHESELLEATKKKEAKKKTTHKAEKVSSA